MPRTKVVSDFLGHQPVHPRGEVGIDRRAIRRAEFRRAAHQMVGVGEIHLGIGAITGGCDGQQRGPDGLGVLGLAGLTIQGGAGFHPGKGKPVAASRQRGHIRIPIGILRRVIGFRRLDIGRLVPRRGKGILDLHGVHLRPRVSGQHHAGDQARGRPAKVLPASRQPSADDAARFRDLFRFFHGFFLCFPAGTGVIHEQSVKLPRRGGERSWWVTTRSTFRNHHPPLTASCGAAARACRSRRRAPRRSARGRH